MRRTCNVIVSSVLMLVLLSLVAYLSYNYGYREGCNFGMLSNENLFKFEDNIFKTVAHIDLSRFENVQLIYEDADNDIAYYMYKGERPWVKVGDNVEFYNGVSSTILATDAYGFVVQNVTEVTFGYSGTAVMNSDGVQIGYVSERFDNGYIYCIWV